MEARLNPNPRRSPAWLLGIAVMAAGCASGSEPTETGPDATTAYMQLASSAASCAEEARQCFEAAQGDTAALEVCRETFRTCQEEQVQPRERDLGEAIRQCVEASADCREQNGDAGPQACDPSECLDDVRPGTGREDAGATPPANGPDAADAGGGMSDIGGPAASCLDELRACVRGGDPMSCAGNVASCIQAELAVPGGPGSNPGDRGSRPDAGSSMTPPDRPDLPDAGSPDPDLPDPDLPDVDAGVSVPDLPDQDAIPDPLQECRDAVADCIRGGNLPFECAQQSDACEPGNRPDVP